MDLRDVRRLAEGAESLTLEALRAATSVPADAKAQEAIVAGLIRAAFASPESVIPIYERVAGGILGETEEPTPWDALARSALEKPEPLGEPFWQAFGELQASLGTGLGAGEVTVRTAALGAHLGDAFRARVEAAAYLYPGVAEMARRPFPAKLELSALKGQPAGSLGQVLHDLLVSNGFDPEVLDREALNIRDLPPALAYLNARVLSLHDVIHLVAGFELKALGEVGISAFQLAQFGHGYSAMFLAVAACGAAKGPALPMLLRVIAEGWRHGRTTPQMMSLPWETLWAMPIAAVRARYGIAPIRSTIPQDLIEQVQAQAAA